MSGVVLRWVVLVVFAASLAACVPAPAPSIAPGGASQPASAASRAEERTLVVAVRSEPVSLATRLLQPALVSISLQRRMFNAELAFLDDKGVTQPYLLKELPQLNTEGWRVFPDGRMETTYRLKDGLTWHDGHALTAHDVVFSWRAYSTPGLGHSTLSPLNAMQEVVALDDQTALIRWRRPYPDVAFVAGTALEFPPLPSHILEGALQADDVDSFANHPWWTREYVGAGPYRLARWEPGTFLEGAAFPGHALGAPKIFRITLKLISDANTAMANLLAGEVQLATDGGLELAQSALLRSDWVARAHGSVLYHANLWRAAHFQNRPDLANPRILLNPMVRKALAHAIDRPLLNDSLFDGQSIISDSMVAPTSVWGAAAQRGAVAYPFDLARSVQLMNEAGYAKGPDGVYTSPTEGRLTFDAKTNAANAAELAAIVDAWKQAGWDVQQSTVPAAQSQDAQLRATYPGVFVFSYACCETSILGYSSANIPTAENRWSGSNRPGWSNAEYDRLVEAFARTLDRSERERQVTEMMRINTEGPAGVSLFISLRPYAHARALQGPREAPPEANAFFNIYQWELH
jgi:peptide/nickel transport system substrate-binding protein